MEGRDQAPRIAQHLGGDSQPEEGEESEQGNPTGQLNAVRD